MKLKLKFQDQMQKNVHLGCHGKTVALIVGVRQWSSQNAQIFAAKIPIDSSIKQLQFKIITVPTSCVILMNILRSIAITALAGVMENRYYARKQSAQAITSILRFQLKN